jgi:hypothetical protein
MGIDFFWPLGVLLESGRYDPNVVRGGKGTYYNGFDTIFEENGLVYIRKSEKNDKIRADLRSFRLMSDGD